MAFTFNLSPNPVPLSSMQRDWSFLDTLGAKREDRRAGEAAVQSAQGLSPEQVQQVTPLLQNAQTRDEGLRMIREWRKPKEYGVQIAPDGTPLRIDHQAGTLEAIGARGQYARPRTTASPSAPTGFRFTSEGGLEPIPGGPADPEYLRGKPDRSNAPPGYVWVDPTDPSKGLSAIPGGPAEKITPETAARIGLADSFIRDLEDEVDADGNVVRPGIRSLVKEGKATGLYDATLGRQGIGEQGRIHARIKAGSEALLRNLTGAGMNLTEASEYAKRYEPTIYDTDETLLDKLSQLERELSSVNRVVARGRSTGSSGKPRTPQRQEPDAPKRLRFNPATGDFE